ncbi:MAG: SCP2 sterol-binding domain-containing protein [Lachnospiraceae bacterium]|nr:SCP2 sterol-binding domain-containing protein [Lachnospiraceae bacterium]
MRIHIYYGGRGLIEDPNLYVLKKMEEVFEELRVKVERFNLFEDKNGILTLPSSLKEADGIILAATVEWMGIGGLMQQFLDACWLYADKEKISNIYMMPVVMATTEGEREAELTLMKAWEILGGKSLHGLSAYVENRVDFELNQVYANIIEKSAENLYRAINQKQSALPSSTRAVRDAVSRGNAIDLTPKESEQLSRFVADDTYVKKQKEDIEELTAMFKVMLGGVQEDEVDFEKALTDHFVRGHEFEGSFAVFFTDLLEEKQLYLKIKNQEIDVSWVKKEPEVDVTMKTTKTVFQEVLSGKITFAEAFMVGKITAKGDFSLLKNLDKKFRF